MYILCVCVCVCVRARVYTTMQYIAKPKLLETKETDFRYCSHNAHGISLFIEKWNT